MKALGIAAVAVTLLSTTAGEVFNFNLGNGKTARIELRDCGSRFCAPWVSVTDSPSRAKRRYEEPRFYEREPTASTAPAPSTATYAPTIPAPAPATNSNSRAAASAAAIPAPQVAAVQPPPPAPMSAPAIPAPSRLATMAANTQNPFEAPADSRPAAPANIENPFAAPAATAPAPVQPIATVQAPAPAPQAVTQPAPPVRTAALPAPQSTAATGPIGEWIVEDGGGRVRIEECGKALCGVVASARDPNETDRKNPDPKLRKRPIIGTPVLLDMQPTRENQWEGQVYNVRDGQTYTAKLSMRNLNTLRLEGCVMGGMFCGGQTWKRVQ